MHKNKSKDRFRKWGRLFIFLAVMTVVIIAARAFGIGALLEEETLRGWIEGTGPWGPLAYIALYTLATALFVPGTPLTVAGGVIFGPVLGTIYTIIGATTGASVAFLIARYAARAQVEQMLRGRMKAIDEGVNEKGWVYVAITRLIPFFPYNLLNYAFGLTGIKFSHYVVASFIFMLPGTAAYVVFSSSLLDLLRGEISTEFILGLLLLTIVSLLPLLFRKNREKILPG